MCFSFILKRFIGIALILIGMTLYSLVDIKGQFFCGELILLNSLIMLIYSVMAVYVAVCCKISMQ